MGLGSAAAGALVWTHATGQRWERHLPEAWLLHQLTRAAPPARVAALDELERRARRGMLSAVGLNRFADRLVASSIGAQWDPSATRIAELLSDATVPEALRDALVQRVLDQQRDRSALWEPTWGTALESARLTGRLDLASLERYTHHSAAPLLRLQPRGPVRPRTPVALDIDCRWRLGQTGLVRLAVDAEPIDAAIAMELPRAQWTSPMPGARAPGDGGAAADRAGAVVFAAPDEPGTYSIGYRMQFTVLEPPELRGLRWSDEVHSELVVVAP